VTGVATLGWNREFRRAFCGFINSSVGLCGSSDKGGLGVELGSSSGYDGEVAGSSFGRI
jgi:hypothetical protein